MESRPGTTIVPHVSVVMGVYNAGPALRDTLDSILAQVVTGFELIAVDDGSTDGSGDLLDAYAAGDSRVRVIHQANQGLTRALMNGCDAAKGTYIARHDAGDLSKPYRLARQQQLLDADPRLSLVSCATDFIGPEGEYLFTSYAPAVADSPVSIVDAAVRSAGVSIGPTHHGAAMFRRDAYQAVGGYRPQFYFGQDWDLWYRLGERGLFQSLDEPMYAARVTPDSISGAGREAQQKLAALSLAALDARSRNESEDDLLAQAGRIRNCRPLGNRERAAGLYFIGEALRRNGDPRARRYLRDARRAWPFHVRAWVRSAQIALGGREGSR